MSKRRFWTRFSNLVFGLAHCTEIAALASSDTTKRQPSVLYPILGFFAATILFRLATSWWGAQHYSRYAGPARGDRNFSADVIPASISGWARKSFTAPSEENSQGSIGWSHSWNMTRQDQSALVSFDQVGFMGWHELTQCYCAVGWSVTSREIRPSGTNEPWDYVECLLENPTGEKAILLYSIFNGESVPVAPPAATIKETIEQPWLASRQITPGGRSIESGRCLQAQVLASTGPVINQDIRESITHLHLQTRELFRAQWHQQTEDARAENKEHE